MSTSLLQSTATEEKIMHIRDDMFCMIDDFIRLIDTWSEKYIICERLSDKLDNDNTNRCELESDRIELYAISTIMESIRKEISLCLDKLKEEDSFDELLILIKNEYNFFGENFAMRDIIELINEKKRNFGKVTGIVKTTCHKADVVVNVGTESSQKQGVKGTKIKIGSEKRKILRGIIQLLERDDRPEFKDFMEKLRKRRCRSEDWSEFYSFAITAGYDDLVRLIQEYNDLQ